MDSFKAVAAVASLTCVLLTCRQAGFNPPTPFQLSLGAWIIMSASLQNIIWIWIISCVRYCKLLFPKYESVRSTGCPLRPLANCFALSECWKDNGHQKPIKFTLKKLSQSFDKEHAVQLSKKVHRFVAQKFWWPSGSRHRSHRWLAGQPQTQQMQTARGISEKRLQEHGIFEMIQVCRVEFHGISKKKHKLQKFLVLKPSHFETKKLHLQGQGNSRAASLGEDPGHGHDASPPELMTGNVAVLEYKNH